MADRCNYSIITGHNDLRPISVTPILSRIVERLVVKDHIMPFVPCEQLFDQYGFKRTGSTTAALIDVTHTVVTMIEIVVMCDVWSLTSRKHSIVWIISN